jgi:lipopolysaccharide transport system permease protein
MSAPTRRYPRSMASGTGLEEATPPPATAPGASDPEIARADTGRRARGQTVVIEPTRGWRSLQLGEVWSYRELMGFLVWRDLTIRYRQTALGIVWVILQPLALATVITLFFGLVIKAPSGGVPYPLFVFSALMPWTLFNQSLNASSTSLIAGSALVAKIYFPRLVMPLAAAGSYLLDFLVGLAFLAVMMVFYGYAPNSAVLLLPLFVLLALATALGAGVFLAALNVRYRDVQTGVPLLIQLWFFASPIAYPLSLIPEGTLRTLYGLNPMATVIQGFRWALIDAPPPSLAATAISVGFSTFLLGGAFAYFRRTERTFADVI